jgi:hypothetical protein
MTREHQAHRPASGAGCIFYPAGGLCRRQAPSPTTEAFELPHWPPVRPVDRCSSDVAVTDGDVAGMTMCETCIHWLQAGDEPLKPAFRQGRPIEWWARSGYCIRFAPSPSPDEDRRRTYWRVTHAHNCCGDGKSVELAPKARAAINREVAPAE